MKGLKKGILKGILLSLTAMPSLTHAADCNVEYKDIASPKITIVDYVDSKKECYPPLKKALEQGGLEDVLLEPDTEKLLEILADTYGGEIEGFADYLKGELDNYFFNNILGQYSMVLPAKIENIHNSKRYMVLFDDVFDEGIVNNDLDFNSLLAHNLKTIHDLNEGISYGSQTINLGNISDQSVSQAFLDNLIKVRAYSFELDDAMAKYAIIGDFGISTDYLADIATKFQGHHKSLGSWAKTHREKEILNMELNESLFEIHRRPEGFDLTHKVYGVTVGVGFKVGRF